jgi:hypothetical protein
MAFTQAVYLKPVTSTRTKPRESASLTGFADKPRPVAGVERPLRVNVSYPECRRAYPRSPRTGQNQHKFQA